MLVAQRLPPPKLIPHHTPILFPVHFYLKIFVGLFSYFGYISHLQKIGIVFFILNRTANNIGVKSRRITPLYRHNLGLLQQLKFWNIPGILVSVG